jgi:hypothetical protein
VSVSTLVGIAATHCVGGSCIVLVTHGFVAASHARVMLAALMAMRPTVVAGKGMLVDRTGLGVPGIAAWGLGSFTLASASATFPLMV